MTTVNCIRCGSVNLIADEVCKVCGTELRAPVYTEPSVDGDDQSVPPRVLHAIPRFDGPGDGIGPTLKLFWNNLWLITKTVFVIVAPFEIFKALSLRNIQANDWQLMAGTAGLQILCIILIAPALLYALTKVIETGTAPGINESYRWALTKLPKLLLAAFLGWLAVAGGTLACIIPGIIIGVALQVLYPVAVFEKGSALDALKRSWELTKGHRWNIFLAGLVIGIVTGLASLPASGVTAILAMNEVHFWPLEAVVAIFTDIVSETSTVLSLVIYLGILRASEQGRLYTVLNLK